MYVYLKTEPTLFTVGFYEPNGKWKPESDWSNKDDAAERVAWLNGSYTNDIPKELFTLSNDTEGENGMSC